MSGQRRREQSASGFAVVSIVSWAGAGRSGRCVAEQDVCHHAVVLDDEAAPDVDAVPGVAAEVVQSQPRVRAEVNGFFQKPN